MDGTDLSTLASWLLKATWQGSVLVGVVVVLQWAFGSRLSARGRYGLWLLVVVRLLLPFSIPLQFSLFNSPPLRHAARLEERFVEAFSAKATTLESREFSIGGAVTPSPSGLSILANIWLLGASLLAIGLGLATVRFSRRVSGQRPVTDGDLLDLLEDCKEEMQIHTPVALVETDQIETPALLGVIRPRILLPRGFLSRFTPEEVKLVFFHELGHLKRADLFVGWITALVLLLHWFNPIVWYAYRRMKADRELACDSVALGYLGEDENRLYGHTLLKLIESLSWQGMRSVPALAGLAEERRDLEERIVRIAEFPGPRRSGAWIATILLGLLVPLTLTDSIGRTKSFTFVAVPAKGQALTKTSAQPAKMISNRERCRDLEVDGSVFLAISKIAGSEVAPELIKPSLLTDGYGGLGAAATNLFQTTYVERLRRMTADDDVNPVK
jgi:beta-lactamase regulating signal transducer with metallopeptidase domain